MTAYKEQDLGYIKLTSIKKVVTYSINKCLQI